MRWRPSGAHLSAARPVEPIRPPARFAHCPPHPTAGLEYDNLARGLRKALERDPSALDADKLAAVAPETVAAWLDPPTLAFPQLEERARKVREVGRVLLACFGGQAANLVRAAGGSAERLVALVTASFPGFRDESVYKGEQVRTRPTKVGGRRAVLFRANGTSRLTLSLTLTLFPW